MIAPKYTSAAVRFAVNRETYVKRKQIATMTPKANFIIKCTLFDLVSFHFDFVSGG